ncbi:MAG TPA: cation diffusion facilitator family transporter [Bryobacteraceae bacterium]|jgi:cation diffusion facilitator family transporter
MTTTPTAGDQEKQNVAFASVTAALGLTVAKLAAGIFTGSLGILAEAIHSGLDLIAAMVTLVAVRVSSRPADHTHLYGHGKIENLSALFEAGLLVVTCLWIGYEAIERLILGTSQIEVTWWAFAVIGLSIGVDLSRSRMLRKAAGKHHSQALEADAIHFETDIWSSVVVLIGLICVKLARSNPEFEWLHRCDAIAALMVAVLILAVTAKLTIRSAQALLDAAPAGLETRIRDMAMLVPGIADCHQVRMRYVGSRLFADIHVLVDGSQTLRDAHTLTEQVEAAIQEAFPEADVTVHAEPLDV